MNEIVDVLQLLAVLACAVLGALCLRRSRREPESVDLDSPRYTRWLRAGRPQPLAWFLSLSESQQEALAGLAESWLQDVLIAAGWAVRDPEAAHLGLRAQQGDAAAEAELLDRVSRALPGRRGPGGVVGAHEQALAHAALDAVAASRPANPTEELLGMGGLSERRLAREQAEQRQQAASASFLGQRPSGVA